MSAPTLRGVRLARRVAGTTTTVLTFPDGTIVGDLAVVHAYESNGSLSTLPAGWTRAGQIITWSSVDAWWRILDAADIAAGSVTVTAPTGGVGGSALAVVVAGTYVAAVTLTGARYITGISAQPTSITAGLVGGDLALYTIFGSPKTYTATRGTLGAVDGSGNLGSAIYTEAPTTTETTTVGWGWTPTGTISGQGYVLTVHGPPSAVGSLGFEGRAAFYLPSSGSLGVDGQVVFIPREFPAGDPPAPPTSWTPAVPLHQPAQRVSRTYPAPTLDSLGLPVGWVHSTETREDWGWIRVVVDGVDRTYEGATNGMPTLRASWGLQEPFGCGAGTLAWALGSPYQARPSWLAPGKAVDILRLHPDGASTTVLWSGEIGAEHAPIDATSRRLEFDLIGDLWAADTQIHHPPLYRPETDCGTVIADTLSRVPGRRIGPIGRAVTGITTSARGSTSDTPVSFCQQLLATMTTDDGASQWTVGRVPGSSRRYQLTLKDRSTVAATVRYGQPGAAVDLRRDPRDAPNRIYGSGVAPDGYGWGNWKYPFNRADAAPAYPYTNPSHVISVGTTDAGTDSGSGVSDWQRHVNQLGIPGAKVTVDGSYDAVDAAVCRLVQRAGGIQEDGVVGPQTWASTFNVGANGPDLDGAFQMPLAWTPSTMPRLLNADGTDAGPNTAYDPTGLVVERYEEFGPGCTKAQGVRSARAELARNPTPPLVGQIQLTGDPQECSRLDLREGQNIRVRGYQGADVVLHIAGIQVGEDHSVQLTVDERAQDLVTLAGILTRDKEASQDPARMPSRKARRSALARDAIVDFDGESPGGVIPRFALFGGLWSVIHIPVSQQGQVAEVTLTTDTPAAPFVVAFFGDSVTANFLHSHVGDPTGTRSDSYGPFDWDHDTLAEAGFIEAIGGPGQLAGYDHGYQTSPYTGESTPVTGKLRSQAGFSFTSVRPPWLWLAFYSAHSCYISGRLLPAPASL